jgi:hypothetical protein
MNEALQSSESNSIGFEAQYIRTSAFYQDKYPIITTIRSKEELEQYYNQYKDVCDFARRVPPQSIYHTIGFLDAIDKYTDEYFTTHFLVIVMLEERCITDGHRVEEINENGNITIQKLTPRNDSAKEEWNIIIEIANEYSQNNYTVSLKEFVQ